MTYWSPFVTLSSKQKLFVTTISNGHIMGKGCGWGLYLCAAGFGTTVAAAHGSLHISSHIGPIIISSHGVKYTKLSRVAGKGKML